MILALRTDKPEAEILLCDKMKVIAHESWQAHRQLAETIHTKIDSLLETNDIAKAEITGLIIYKGPGSFTGLRIGVSVANALAYAHSAPIVGATGEDWATTGLSLLSTGDNHVMVTPEYGAPVHITTPKK